MGIIGLKGEAEGENVAVSDEPAAFKGSPLFVRLAFVQVVRKKSPFEDYSRFLEELVDRLKSEIRHPDPIRIRIHEVHPKIALAGFIAGKIYLFFEELPITVALF